MKFLILFLVLLLLFFFLKKKESFSNFNSELKCPDNVKDKTNFCMWNKNSNQCECVFQQGDSYLYNFPVCCNQKCNQLSKEECIPDKKLQYYCFNEDATDCVAYNSFLTDKKISGNVCGINNLTNNFMKPYLTYESCKKDLSPCSKNKERNTCIKDSRCGWCSNLSGGGLCLEGTAMGPLDLNKYSYCVPNQYGNKNSWSYGKQIKI